MNTISLSSRATIHLMLICLIWLFIVPDGSWNNGGYVRIYITSVISARLEQMFGFTSWLACLARIQVYVSRDARSHFGLLRCTRSEPCKTSHVVIRYFVSGFSVSSNLIKVNFQVYCSCLHTEVVPVKCNWRFCFSLVHCVLILHTLPIT